MRNKLVVITGASGVLCSEMAREFARKGARVMLLARNPEKLTMLEQEIISSGGFAKAYSVDCCDKAKLQLVENDIYTKYGACDVLINGAGGNTKGAITDNETFDVDDLNIDGIKSFFNIEESDMNFVHKLNFSSSFLVSQVFAKRMINGDASIINISSMSAFSPLTKVLGYSAAKAAINSLTQWMATYFASAGIRVNAIAPGFFATDQNRALLFNEDGSLSARSSKIIKGIPMGRFGHAKELIGTVMWLADSNLSAYVTGVIVPIDGGYSAYSGV